MKRVIEILKLLSLVLLAGIFVLVSLPFMIIAQPFIWIGNWVRERQFRKYLKQLEGKNFFCYNNKSKSIEYIQQYVLPSLPYSVEVIFLNGKTPESDYEQKFISNALFKFKNYHGFPHLLKIRNGVTLDESVNNELFNTMVQNKSVDELILKINGFFERTLTEKTQHIGSYE